MRIDVHVVVLPDMEKSTEGEADTDVPLEQLRTDIVHGLALDGQPEDWQISVAPSNLTMPLSRYRPSRGDTIYLIRKSETRASSFRPR